MNCDLGTSAVFREQWAREAGPHESTTAIPLTLRMNQAPGDAVAMTAAVCSLHAAHPGRFTTSVESPWPEVFENNPHVSNVPGALVQMHYPAFHSNNTRGIHFMQGWCEFLGQALNVSVPLMTNRPHLYFSTPDPPVEDFWVVCSGGKRDFTTKLWHGYQRTVDLLRGRVRFVQVGGARPGVDTHAPLSGVENAVGKTTLRGLFELVRRARGVLCGVSLPMHVAAALQKPAVVIAGGREPVAWNAYPYQHYIHSVGTLSCCATGGCLKSRVRPLGDEFDDSLCDTPTDAGPECMVRIAPEEVAAIILRLQVSRYASAGCCKDAERKPDQRRTPLLSLPAS